MHSTVDDSLIEQVEEALKAGDLTALEDAVAACDAFKVPDRDNIIKTAKVELEYLRAKKGKSWWIFGY